jgi:hypothetical protein
MRLRVSTLKRTPFSGTLTTEETDYLLTAVVFLTLLYFLMKGGRTKSTGGPLLSARQNEDPKTNGHETRNIVLICPSSRHENENVTGGWAILCNEESHNLCCPPNFIRVIKKKKRWVGHVTRIERRKMRAKLRWII